MEKDEKRRAWLQAYGDFMNIRTFLVNFAKMLETDSDFIDFQDPLCLELVDQIGEFYNSAVHINDLFKV